jgi:hypothetical protein
LIEIEDASRRLLRTVLFHDALEIFPQNVEQAVT